MNTPMALTRKCFDIVVCTIIMLKWGVLGFVSPKQIYIENPLRRK